MQFHLNGFTTGDPEIKPQARANLPGDAGAAGPLPETADVLIVGCGPAGLTLAAQLSAFPGIRTCIADQKPGPLLLGQADGIACRTVEMFNAFGFAEKVLREAYWVNETSFWRPSEESPEKGIVRGGWVKDTEEGLSEFPHVILNQARVHDFYLQHMRNSASVLEPHYRRQLLGLTVDPDPAATHPVTATFAVDGDAARTETVRARYAVGCDGARSAVRTSLGLKLHGDSANQAWGVMDVLATTDFPDIRYKSVINAPGGGSVLIIPREGGYLVRIYAEMNKLREGERLANYNIALEDVVAAARKVLHPYTLEVKEVAWWSVYEIGQRMSDRFDDVPPGERAARLPRVFIAGDACHTHSPKAGQGMNVSMQDAFNLGWKLASVLLGRSPPELLHTYSQERHAVAKELIDFDREWAALLSAPVKAEGEDGEGVTAAQVQDYFVRHGRYTAGTATVYAPSILTAAADHQHLAKGFRIGTRFHSAPVIRFADAKPVHLGHVIEADARWRLFAFAPAGTPEQSVAAIAGLCDCLAQDPASPVIRFTPAGEDIDGAIDVRAVFQQAHRELQGCDLPALLLPHKGRLGLRDYEKVFCPDLEHGPDIFDLRGIDRAKGCIVLVRPDQYVGSILPLDARDELGRYFEAFMLEAAQVAATPTLRHSREGGNPVPAYAAGFPPSRE